MDIDMSVANDILNILDELKIDCIEVALNSAQLFNRCKCAADAQDIAKNLSALFLEGKLARDKPQGGIFKYWLPARGLQAEIKAIPTQQQIDDQPIPMFLKAQPNEIAVVASVHEKLGVDQPTVHKATVNEIDINQYETIKIPIVASFKVAITSAKTLVLEGLSYQPIELTQQQARTLCDFLGEFDGQAYFLWEN